MKTQINENEIILTFDNEDFEFLFAPKIFEETEYVNVFKDKNNKTVRETIESKRYKKLSSKILNTYSEYLNWELGKFIIELKTKNDGFYKEFLNPFGDENYCRFKLISKEYKNKTGLYLFSIDGEILYIGSCTKDLQARINNGYGRISPKNCYIDGQSTNCRINSFINKSKEEIALFIYSMFNQNIIKETEIELIQKYTPKWNIQK